MGRNSAIQWCDHTFNPWSGCTKVSQGCAHCYAAEMSRRFAGAFGEWGDDAPRKVASEKQWAEPLRWDRASAKAAAGGGRRARVFCASMADVFEDRAELVAPRARLYKLIRDTPNLDWLLLTKRPENAEVLWFNANVDAFELGSVWADNVWLGTTAEDQQRANERIPHLLAVPARVRFVSVEPMLGPVDLHRGGWSFLEPLRPPPGNKGGHDRGLDWVICGGESGRKPRPMHPDWARSLRDQCKQAGVPFLFKQWGEWFPRDQWEHNPELVLPDDDVALSQAGSLRPLPTCWVTGMDGDRSLMHRVGKAAAGRLLDGVEHNEFPRVEVPGHA